MKTNSLFKNIIPQLLSLDTHLSKLNGFNLGENFNFFQSSGKNKFHYKVVIDEFEVPRKYDFRCAYFLKSKGKWYYERIIYGLTFKFCYDPENKVFIFNNGYRFLPFVIGGLHTVGDYLSSLIALDMFLNDYVYVRGSAVNYKGKNICLMAPSFNGKTSLVIKALESGGRYIADDHLVINLRENKVYPTTPVINRFLLNRVATKRLGGIIQNHKILTLPQNIDRLFIYQNSMNEEYQTAEKGLIDFFYMDNFFLYNPFVCTFIFEEGLRKTVCEKIDDLSKFNYNFASFYNFDFDSILANIDLSLGKVQNDRQ